MKFIIETISREGCRQGIIRELGCHGNLCMETPGCLLYTRAAAVPHAPWDLVEGMKHRPHGMQLSCATLVDQVEQLRNFGKGIAQFASLPKGDTTFVSIQDPAHPCPTGYNDKNGVSVFTPAGRTKIDVGLYITLQEVLQPDWFQALCDGDTPPGCSLKRTRKAVDRTLAMLDECIEKGQKSQKLQQTDILGVIEGGEDLSERQRSARETALRPVAGFSLDAFTDERVDSGSTPMELIEAIVKELPADKPRLLSGVGRPDHVMQAVEAGMDLFDSAYPYEVTQRGRALVFPCKIPQQRPRSPAGTPAEQPSSRESNSNVPHARVEVQGNGEVDARFELDLSDKRFAEDFSPVVLGCQCYCCTSHTRAYVNHLLNVNELLAKVLLMNHNLQHYFYFFHAIRSSLKQGTFQQLKEAVMGTQR